MKLYCSLLFLFLLTLGCSSSTKPMQETFKLELSILERLSPNHLRGLYTVSDSIVWASGVQGTVITTSNGKDWKNVSIVEASELDFRDIHAFSEKEAVVLSAGNGVSIYKTMNGGEKWILVFEDTNRLLFYDGFDFNKNGVGIAFGDPINGRMTLLKSVDFGTTWQLYPESKCPLLEKGEAGFAASGTGIVMFDDKFLIATGGGPLCHLLEFSLEDSISNKFQIPIGSGDGTGVFSIAFWNKQEGVAVGGNYVDSANASSNCAITSDGGKTWQLITQNNPKGYRSCVTSNQDGSLLICSGRTGIDYSIDQGKSWKALSSEGYYSCAIGEKVAWLVGKNGKMGKLVLH